MKGRLKLHHMLDFMEEKSCNISVRSYFQITFDEGRNSSNLNGQGSTTGNARKVLDLELELLWEKKSRNNII